MAADTQSANVEIEFVIERNGPNVIETQTGGLPAKSGAKLQVCIDGNWNEGMTDETGRLVLATNSGMIREILIDGRQMFRYAPFSPLDLQFIYQGIPVSGMTKLHLICFEW